MNAYVYMGDSTYVELPSQLMGPQKTENKNEFQVQINKNQSLNQFLKESLAENFTFESIKPKTNRLEQLYLELT